MSSNAHLTKLAVALAAVAVATTFAGCGTEERGDNVQETVAAVKVAPTASTAPKVNVSAASAASAAAAANTTVQVAPTASTAPTVSAGAASDPRVLAAATAALTVVPRLGYVGDANDTATILTDADFFWTTYFGDSDEFVERLSLTSQFEENGPDPWKTGRLTSALVQMYDLLAPIDTARAEKYLGRLHSYAQAILASRDDNNGAPADPFRGRVMPAWGAYTPDRDNNWNTDVVTSGLCTYAMAAFARRVLENPSLLSDNPGLQDYYRRDAISFVSAVLETYEAFRPEMHLDGGDSEAYFTVPQAYSTLRCIGSTEVACRGYRDTAGMPLAYNENFSMMKALAETALASNTPLYLGSQDATALRLSRSLNEVPLLIAKNFVFFDHHLQSKSLSDGTPYFVWNAQEPTSRVQDTPHANFELGSLAVLLLDQPALNVLLTANGHTDQLGLSTPLFVRFANTFLRKVWNYDFTNSDPDADGQNLLGARVDGSRPPTETNNYNKECAGWIPLAQFSSWVWTRCRDAIFHGPGYLDVDSDAALLRYRQYHP
jgi:hypothetical protein